MSTDSNKKSVLLFDDTKFLLKGLQRFLQPEFDCYIAIELEEGKSILDKNKIDVVVADHQMPDDIGIELLRYAQEKFPKIRRILTTSDRHKDLVLLLIESNIVHGFVYTPISREVLKTEIVDQLTKS